MIVTGVALAACAALTHTAIDSTRKYAASVIGIPSDGLVTVPAILDMILSCAGVSITGSWRGTMKHPTRFAIATISSSLLLLVSRYMYQRAIQISPLSLTIPYLAFTPAILIATAYVFLGELPSPAGVLGVSVVALGGYLLNIKAGGAGGGASAGGGGSPVSGPGGAVAISRAISETGVPSSAASSTPGSTAALGSLAYSPAVAAAAAGQLPGVVAGCGVLLQRSASSSTVADVEAAAGGAVGGAALLGGASKRGGKLLLGTPQPRRAASAVDLLRQPPAMAWQWQQEPGTVLMIGVAIIWSVTASLDKLGVITGPSIWVYFAAQRLAIGTASLAYILAVQPRLLLLLRDHFGLMLGISALELAAVLLFLLAVRHLLVSYVVAIKRCNVLFSVVLGALVFRESVRSRLPYVFLMMLGMTLIVLEPGGHSFVHSHT
ncbi:hypothetical protein Agub_g1001 [Astrephomene gubernaculifera]|uniref:EamA domain-containing protein n=1 Tax=Astrephomene gubernaculifera TaxID=47775 RepID=A0AAD3DGP0_9CHLO|nr:hypothetical protein Agub_g1001 [Astrephomene gubernaculifera]